MGGKNRSEGISIREFARREGCDEKLVRRAIEQGRLAKMPNGKMNPADLGVNWRGTADADRKRAEPVRMKDGETPEQAAERLTDIFASQFATKADAEKVKETYLALLRKLEFDEKSGEVVKIAAVAKRVGEEYARVRSRLMSIPAEVAPTVAAFKSAEEVRDYLEREITLVLGELSADVGRAIS